MLFIRDISFIQLTKIHMQSCYNVKKFNRQSQILCDIFGKNSSFELTCNRMITKKSPLSQRVGESLEIALAQQHQCAALNVPKWIVNR